METELRKLLLIALFEMIRIGRKNTCPECTVIGGHFEGCPLKEQEEWVDKEIAKLRQELGG